MNNGLRIILDQRGALFWFTITEHGQQHESGRGYSTLVEALEQADLYRRLQRQAKWRERDKRLAQS